MKLIEYAAGYTCGNIIGIVLGVILFIAVMMILGKIKHDNFSYYIGEYIINGN
jgi:hypothetical protein